MLSQAVRRVGRPDLPIPGFVLSTIGSSVPQLRGSEMSGEQVSFLTYGRALDTTRMRRELGFEPRYTTEQAFDAFAQRLRPGVLNAERVEGLERHARNVASEVVTRAGR
jgi:UDP-glucose 4-epimerase